MTAAAAGSQAGQQQLGSDTDSALPPPGYVNAPAAPDYLRPLADRTTEQPVDPDTQLLDTASSAAETDAQYIDDGVQDVS